MSSVPDAVRKQAQEAEKRAQQLLNPGQNSGDEQTPADPAAAAPDLNSMLDDEQGGDPTAGDGTPQAGDQDEGRGPDDSDNDAGTAGQDRDDDLPQSDAEKALYWKRRFKTLEGKYRREVIAAREEHRELQAQLQAQRARDQQDPGKPPAQADQGKVNEIVKALRDEYPSDLVDNLIGLIEAKVAGQASTNQVPKDFETVRKTVEDLSADAFNAKLTAASPGWEKLDDDERWLTYLDGIEPISGARRQDLLNAHVARKDVKRVAAMIDDYRKRIGKKGSENRGEPPPEPDNQGHSPPPQPPEQGKVWTMSEVRAINRAEAAGKYNSPADREKLRRVRAKIEQAVAEGRFDYTS